MPIGRGITERPRLVRDEMFAGARRYLRASWFMAAMRAPWRRAAFHEPAASLLSS